MSVESGGPGQKQGPRAEGPPSGPTPGRGRLVLVATPIGNLGDLSPRAGQALAAADVVCCEDTRHSRKLLTAAGIRAERLVAVHEHNERAQAVAVVRWLAEGKVVAVVTDAGLPGISDPGERLVQAAAAAGHVVEVVPGPSAAVAGLVVSGLPTGRFCFEGFLPRKGAERARRVAAVAAEERTTVLFEAPHRLASTLGELAAACGPDRPCALARELTKLHEEVWRGTLAAAAARASEAVPRGEHVVVLGGAAPAATSDEEVAAAVAEARAAGLSARDAANEVAERLGVTRNRAYAATRTGPAGGRR
ncbi:MAG: 16S rRNA (cytidine(1402)-2'-O)-methyltransferase [Acidimicrobiales bacterium]